MLVSFSVRANQLITAINTGFQSWEDQNWCNSQINAHKKAAIQLEFGAWSLQWGHCPDRTCNTPLDLFQFGAGGGSTNTLAHTELGWVVLMLKHSRPTLIHTDRSANNLCKNWLLKSPGHVAHESLNRERNPTLSRSCPGWSLIGPLSLVRLCKWTEKSSNPNTKNWYGNEDANYPGLIRACCKNVLWYHTVYHCVCIETSHGYSCVFWDITYL